MSQPGNILHIGSTNEWIRRNYPILSINTWLTDLQGGQRCFQRIHAYMYKIGLYVKS